MNSAFVGYEELSRSRGVLSTSAFGQFPLSIFLFIAFLDVSALQDAGGYAISGKNNLELHLGCHTC